VKVAVRMQAGVADGGEFLANVRALEAAGAEAIALDGESSERQVVLGAIAAVTERVSLVTAAPIGEALMALARGRAVAQFPPDEKWVEIDLPGSREAWSATLRDHESSGTTGVIVPWDPRLIDLLRNPEPDDRSDLLMSTG
jgi:hypothetical protein